MRSFCLWFNLKVHSKLRGFAALLCDKFWFKATLIFTLLEFWALSLSWMCLGSVENLLISGREDRRKGAIRVNF